MSLRTKAPDVALDADDNPIDPDEMYVAIDGFATGDSEHGAWSIRRGQRERGDDYRVLHNASLWVAASAGDSAVVAARYRKFPNTR